MKYLFLLLLLGFSCDGTGELQRDPNKGDTGLSDSSRSDVTYSDADYEDVKGSIAGCGIQEMYNALAPTCANCHRGGTTPYFATGTSFYRLLVANEKWVVAGDPDKSELINLLVGEASGQYTQMPLGEKNYDDLAKENSELVSVDAVRDFVRNLEGCTPGEPEKADRVLVRRKNARQIFNSLRLHLGLEDSDMRNGGQESYPMWSPDDVLPFDDGVNVNGFISPAAQRWHAFGGESYLANIRATEGLTPTFGQTITQVSQAWCRTGLEKDNNQAFYRHVNQADLAAASDDDIKKNIRYLMLRFWGEVVADEEVDAMFSDLYSSYSQAEDPQVAWISVCAALIRDPLWLVY